MVTRYLVKRIPLLVARILAKRIPLLVARYLAKHILLMVLPFRLRLMLMENVQWPRPNLGALKLKWQQDER